MQAVPAYNTRQLMNRHRLRSHSTVFALGCICAGVAFRVGISVSAPVGYDEVFVMGIGLDEMTESARALLIDVPLRRSNAITPLWWWVQTVPVLLTGRITLWGLRLGPLLLGTATLAVTFRLAAARLGRGPAALLVALTAFCDILAFVNARGEFADSLLLLWVIPCVCLVGSPRHTLAKGVLGWLILMTHLGKGLFVVGALTGADAVAQAVRCRRFGALVRPGIAFAIAFVPTLCWLMIAGGLAGGGPMVTDIGPVAGPADALWKLTAGYAETKGHMIATPFDAAQPWLDGWVWPITAITAFPVLVGIATTVGRFGGRRGAMCLGLTPWVVLGLAVIVARGLAGVRFHLLYLPAAWVTASIGLWRLRRLSRGPLVVLGGLWVLSVWVAFSWAGWEGRSWRPSVFALLPAAACAATVGLVLVGLSRRSAGGRTVAACVSAGLLAAVVLAYGPLRWAPFARLEPYAGQSELAAIDAYRLGLAPLPGPHGRTLYIDLANYFLTKDDRTADDLRRGEYYARLETERVPEDARAWFYLGEALRQSGGPTGRVRSVWERSYRLDPTPLLEQRLEDLRREGGARAFRREP